MELRKEKPTKKVVRWVKQNDLLFSVRIRTQRVDEYYKSVYEYIICRTASF